MNTTRPIEAMSFEDFAADARERGFDDVLERSWAPHQVVDEHGHPFAVDAIVVKGTMWLTDTSGTRRLVPGDTFKLDANVPHSERYGPEGATYWVARKS